MLFLIKMFIIGAIVGVVSGLIEGLINANVKDEKVAKTLNRYVTAIDWLIVVYMVFF